MGLDGLLRSRAGVLTGILNGIDTDCWDPARDPHLAERFDARTLARRSANKAALQTRFGLEALSDAPLFGVVSRLTWQKGMDVLLEAVDDLVALGGQLARVGSGEAALEAGLASAAARHAGRVGILLGFDEAAAHLVQGGADAFLVPSRFEPCGLTQLCALRYGAIPVVARVGGLADTVIDANEMALVASAGNGLQFAPVTREAWMSHDPKNILCLCASHHKSGEHSWDSNPMVIVPWFKKKYPARYKYLVKLSTVPVDINWEVLYNEIKKKLNEC